MIEILCFGVLIGIIVLQQISNHKLVNKLMSSNFHEYKTAVNLKTEMPVVKLPDTEEMEDLGSLQGIQTF